MVFIIINRRKPHSQLLLPLLVFHPLHNPPARLLRILVRLLLVFHRLLHLREIIRHIHALVDSRPLLNRLQPSLDLRELTRLDARPLAPVDPREDAYVGESVLVADEVGGLAGGDAVGCALGGEAVVEDLVEAVGFGLVAVYRVVDLFGGVLGVESVFCCWILGVWFGRLGRTSEEVVCLALHGADAALLWFEVLALYTFGNV